MFAKYIHRVTLSSSRVFRFRVLHRTAFSATLYHCQSSSLDSLPFSEMRVDPARDTVFHLFRGDTSPLLSGRVPRRKRTRGIMSSRVPREIWPARVDSAQKA